MNSTLLSFPRARCSLALRWAACVILSLGLLACSPGLDWREVRPAESGMVLMFPCKPEISSRPATPSEPARMGMAQCKADGITFSLSWAEVRDPALVTPAMRQMRQALLRKLGGDSASDAASLAPPQALHVPGMTPNPEALQQHVRGSGRPDAREADIAVFTRGVWVYQAVMLAPKRQPAAWDGFINAMKLEI